MTIPTYEEAIAAMKAGTANPLDRFVAWWEPQKEDEKFRYMLKELLDWNGGRIHPAIAEGIVEDADRTQEMMVNLNYGTQENLMNAFWNPSTNQYEEKR